MNLKEQIKADLKTAMKEKNEVAKNTLKNILAEFTNELVATGRMPQDTLTEEEQIKVIKRLQKQRKDAQEKFTAGGREDLAANETAELEIIEKYLPETMALEDIIKIAQEKKEELSINDKSKMGILIGAILKSTQGQADGVDVKKAVETLF